MRVGHRQGRAGLRASGAWTINGIPFSGHPRLECTLWRYIDRPKLIDLLTHKALYFPPAAQLGDDFEGSIPIVNAPDPPWFTGRSTSTCTT